MSAELQEKVGKLYFQPYSEDKKNIIIVGPVPGKKYSEMVFPILAPDPSKSKEVNYLTYPIYLGGNRGRGQVYPDGTKSNNTVYNSPATGTVTAVNTTDKGVDVIITSATGDKSTTAIPAGPDILVSAGQSVQADQPLTNNPNVGGFGQGETEIVLQNPARLQGLIIFLGFVLIAQVFLVLKKKQFEKVQLSEMNF